jgi:hypothetical protein
VTLKYFKVKELVPKAVYAERGEAAIELMDARILKALDDLRAATKAPMTVNDATHQFRGLRTPDCKEFSPYSQHTFGRAVDAVSVLKPEAYHKEILVNPDKYPGVTFIEIDITWLHIDCRDNADGSGIKCWSPARGFVDPKVYLREIVKRGL